MGSGYPGWLKLQGWEQKVTFDNVSSCSGWTESGGSVSHIQELWCDLSKGWHDEACENPGGTQARAHTHTLLHSALPLLASHTLFSPTWCGEKGGAFYCSFLFLYKLEPHLLPRLAINPWNDLGSTSRIHCSRSPTNARHMQPFTLCDHLYTAEGKLWESLCGYNHISRVRRWQHHHVLLHNVMILGVELRLNLFFFFF